MKTIEQLKTDRTTFSIGKAFSDGWAMVSKHLGYYILGGVITLVISFASSLIPYAGEFANSIILGPCLMAGAIFVTWNISKGLGWADLGDMFKGFKFLQPLAIATLIQSFAYVVIFGLVMLNYIDELMRLFELSRDSYPFQNQEEIKALLISMLDGRFILMLLMAFIACLFIAVIWAFRSHFIVIYNLQAWPAMDMSRRIASHNFFQLTGLFILMGIIVVISALPCGIGLLFSLPLTIGTTYSAFAQITHCDDPEEINSEMFDFIDDQQQVQG